MNRAAILVVATVAAMAAGTAPATAATGSASAGGVTVTYVVEDTAFDGPDCRQVPVRATFSGFGSLTLEGAKAGSKNTISTYLYSVSDGPSTVEETLQVCPNVDGPGAYELRGKVEAGDATAPLAAGQTLTISQAPAQITGLAARQRGGVLTVTGKATAASSRGQIGASGTVTVLGLLPKSKGGKGKWITIGEGYLDEFGAFTVQGATSQKLKGARIRAELTPDGWSGGATASTSVK